MGFKSDETLSLEWRGWSGRISRSQSWW